MFVTAIIGKSSIVSAIGRNGVDLETFALFPAVGNPITLR
jgi:hypothetical protein